MISLPLFLAPLGLSTTFAHADPPSAIPPPPNPAYQRVFAQDYTTLKTLAVSAHDLGDNSWIAHTPSYTDWFSFQDPGAPYHPFAIENGYLTIRVQKDGNDPHNYFGGYSGGLLSSMDAHGKGFAQQYGYFEASMQTPGTPNTWPGFWLLDAPTLTDQTLPDGAEIDITESYGNYGTGPRQMPEGDPDEDGVAWHNWGHNGNATTSAGTFAKEAGMTTGFHTYGADIEPDLTTFYFDRKQVWQVPTFSAERRPMFVLVNLALGGGTHNNADGSNYDWNLTPIPSDLRVKYVAVWASPNSPNYSGKAAAPTSVKAVSGNGKVAVSWLAGGSSVNLFRGDGPGKEAARPIAENLGSSSTYIDTDVKNGGRYSYRVAAMNASGLGAASAEVAASPTADAGASAVFVKTDTTTKGDWRTAYGAEGHRIFADKTDMRHDPAYAAVVPSTDHTFTWPPSTDPRALQTGASASDRIVAELHADKTVTFDIDLTDGKPHSVALYFLDWDRKGEINAVTISDAVFGNTLDTHTFSDFSGGQYGVWTLKGHVRVSIANAAPTATNSQATVSGLFFGGGT